MNNLKRTDLVNAQEIGDMFGMNPRHVVDRLAKREGFPKGRKPGREYLWYKWQVEYWFKYGKYTRKGTSEYKAWQHMRERCNNPSHSDYPSYGGRGITVCEEWDSSFERFISDVGTKPASHLSIDRIDNNRNYEPSNCRWATASQQQQNKRSNT